MTMSYGAIILRAAAMYESVAHSTTLIEDAEPMKSMVTPSANLAASDGTGMSGTASACVSMRHVAQLLADSVSADSSGCFDGPARFKASEIGGTRLVACDFDDLNGFWDNVAVVI